MKTSFVLAAILLGIALLLGMVLGWRTIRPERVTEQPGAESDRQSAGGPAGAGATRTNEGGAVTFEVTPLNLGSTAETLDLEVVMNTHSVDLGFDLANQAVLRTDTGAEIVPSAYQGGSGHHVTGRLSFPAAQIGNARTLTLIIRDVAGVAERTFTWEL